MRRLPVAQRVIDNLGMQRVVAGDGLAAGQDDDETFALIWNPVD